MWFLALFAVVLSGVLLGLSAFPGVLEQVPFGPAIGGGLALVVAVLAVRRLRRPGPRRWAVVVLAAAVLTPVLLWAHLPRAAVFRLFRGEFEALLTKAPPAGNKSVVGLNADLDIYWVDQWGTDARGGTYFRTLTGSGPADRRSFGFAHRPNPDGSPFGDADYRVRHLAGDWYSFEAAE